MKFAVNLSYDFKIRMTPRGWTRPFLMAIPGEVQSRNGVPKGILREALGGVLPKAVAVRKSKADFTAVVNAGLAKDREIVAQRLQPDGMTAARGYVRGDMLQDMTTRLAGINGPTAEPMCTPLSR